MKVKRWKVKKDEKAETIWDKKQRNYSFNTLKKEIKSDATKKGGYPK